MYGKRCDLELSGYIYGDINFPLALSRKAKTNCAKRVFKKKKNERKVSTVRELAAHRAEKINSILSLLPPEYSLRASLCDRALEKNTESTLLIAAQFEQLNFFPPCLVPFFILQAAANEIPRLKNTIPYPRFDDEATNQLGPCRATIHTLCRAIYAYIRFIHSS